MITSAIDCGSSTSTRSRPACPAAGLSWRLPAGSFLHRLVGGLEADVAVPSGSVAELVLPDGSTRELPPGQHRVS